MMAAAEAATVATALRDGTATLQHAGIETARLDAELLLARAGGWSRAAFLTRLRDPLAPSVGATFTAALARRARREPLAYITGEKEFWSLPFLVTPDVLVPRPETEMLVEAACRRVAAQPAARVCDVGTGSGCIAVAVAHTHPLAQVVGLDLSPAALRVARRNVELHAVAERVELLASDLFAALPAAQTFDVIVSNPPYLADGDGGSPEIAWEPVSALRAGPEGLDVIERLLAAAPRRLRPGGLLAIEIGMGQERLVCERAIAAGFEAVGVRADLAGIPRLLSATKAGA